MYEISIIPIFAIKFLGVPMWEIVKVVLIGISIVIATFVSEKKNQKMLWAIIKMHLRNFKKESLRKQKKVLEGKAEDDKREEKNRLARLEEGKIEAAKAKIKLLKEERLAHERKKEDEQKNSDDSRKTGQAARRSTKVLAGIQCIASKNSESCP